MSYTYILSDIICDTFEEKVGRNNPDKALKVSFHVNPDYSKEDGNRYMDLLIWGPMNYVAVFFRDRWNVIDLSDLEDDGDGDTYIRPGATGYVEGEGALQLKAYHDSCWREDGVKRILFEYLDKVASLDNGLKRDFYEVIDVTDEMRECLQNRRGG